MDVSSWTIDQRMRLPDWCFGNRKLIGVYNFENVVGVKNWEISSIALPDPACIWEFGFMGMYYIGSRGTWRVGLAHAKPVNVGQMDAAVELLPYFGIEVAGPNRIGMHSQTHQFGQMTLRKGMATGGMKLVTENDCAEGTSRIMLWVVVSGLPTNMAGWMAHNKV